MIAISPLDALAGISGLFCIGALACLLWMAWRRLRWLRGRLVYRWRNRHQPRAPARRYGSEVK